MSKRTPLTTGRCRVASVVVGCLIAASGCAGEAADRTDPSPVAPSTSGQVTGDNSGGQCVLVVRFRGHLYGDWHIQRPWPVKATPVVGEGRLVHCEGMRLKVTLRQVPGVPVGVALYAPQFDRGTVLVRLVDGKPSSFIHDIPRILYTR